MSTDTKLTWDDDGEAIDDIKYRGMIGSLLYRTASGPDIMFSICLYSRFSEAPKTFHLEAVKRIFHYIKVLPILAYGFPREPALRPSSMPIPTTRATTSTERAQVLYVLL